VPFRLNSERVQEQKFVIFDLRSLGSEYLATGKMLNNSFFLLLLLYFAESLQLFVIASSEE
jgi:hypothetical protein